MYYSQSIDARDTSDLENLLDLFVYGPIHFSCAVFPFLLKV